LFPLLGYSLMTNSAVYRYAWLGCLFFGVFWYGGHRLHQWLLDLHDSIRDDRYLVGRRLHNYGDHKKAPPSPELLRLQGAGLEEAEDGADAQGDEATQATRLNSDEQKRSGEELNVDTGVATGAQRMGATASTLKFRGAVSHEGISS
jgi:E3 ubiquitin-protein ligase MARCH6